VRHISHITIFSLGLCAAVASACSGPATSSPPEVTTREESGIRPLAASPTPSPIPFRFQTVDVPNSDKNRVTVINELGAIAGVFGTGEGDEIWESYISRPHHTIKYPGARGTYVTSGSSRRMAGFVVDPGGKSGTFGFMRVKGVWSLFTDPNQGTGADAVTVIWDFNDSGYAVGYYLNSSGKKVPFGLNISTGIFTDLKPPGAHQAEATGINGKGDISGWEQGFGEVQGFLETTGTYFRLSFPGAAQTRALRLNWQDQIVGDYVDSSGKTHGYLLSFPQAGQIWQSIDEPKAVNVTSVTGVNNQDQICGYYVDGNGVQNGFIANP
jgi:hypothetical protein